MDLSIIKLRIGELAMYSKMSIGVDELYTMRDSSILCVVKPRNVVAELSTICASTEKALFDDLVKRCHYMFSINNQIQHVVVTYQEMKNNGLYSMNLGIVASEKFISQMTIPAVVKINSNLHLTNGLYFDLIDPSQTFKDIITINDVLYS